jgi:membrane protease YdiL (CAAX protease family)
VKNYFSPNTATDNDALRPVGHILLACLAFMLASPLLAALLANPAKTLATLYAAAVAYMAVRILRHQLAELRKALAALDEIDGANQPNA